MGLTLVEREDGTQGYEYLEEDEDLQLEQSTNKLGDVLSGAQRGLSEALSAEEDDNLLEGTLKTGGRLLQNAVVGGVQELSDTVRDLGEWSGIAPEGTGTTREEQDKPIIGFGEWKPVKADNEQAYLRGVEDFSTGVVQFALEWVALSKILRGANWMLQGSKIPALSKTGHTLSKIGQFEKTIQTGVAAKSASVLAKTGVPRGTAALLANKVTAPIAGAAYNATVNPKGMAIDFAGFNQWDGRLMDLAANSEWFGWVANLPGAQALITNPDDTAMEGRFKNIIEGWDIDFNLGGAIKGWKAKPTDNARLIIEVTKGKGYAQQLTEAIAKFGEDSLEALAIREKIAATGEKIANNPIIRWLTGNKQKEIPKHYDWVKVDPDATSNIYPEGTPLPRNADAFVGTDEAAFNRSLANIPAKERAKILAAIRAKQGRNVKELWPFGKSPEVDPTEMDQIRKGNIQLTPQVRQSLEAYRKASMDEFPGVKEQYEALEKVGKEPPKPGKGEFYEVVDGKKRQTAAAKKWNQWNRERKKVERWNENDNQAMNPAMREAYADWQELDKELAELISQPDGTWFSSMEPSFSRALGEEFIEPNPQIMQAVMQADQILENALPDMANAPLKSFETNTKRVEFGKGMAGLRGVEYLKKRIRNAKNVNKDDLQDIIAFLDLLDESYFKDVSFDRVRRTGDNPTMGGRVAEDPQKRGPMGQFDFTTKIVQIRTDIIESSALTRTMVHELWHSLSRFLPNKSLSKLNKEFIREKKKYIKSLDKVDLAFFEAAEQGRIGYTEEAYRFKDIDEYFAETMLGEFLDYLDIRANLAPDGTLKRMAQELGILLGNIMASVKSKLGISQTKKIFNDYLYKRNLQFRRTVPLEAQETLDKIASGDMGFLSSLLDNEVDNMGIKNLPDFPDEGAIPKDGDGVVGRDVNKNELKSIVDNLVENARRIDAGEITEQELINDIVNISSAGKRKLKYGPLDDLSLGSIFKVISDVHSRLAATGIPSLNTQALMDDEILKAQQYGLNAEQTRLFAENVGKFFANNETNIRNLHNLRLLTIAMGQAAGTKAANVMNAMNIGEMNWNKQAKELEMAVLEGVATFRLYQTWTRGLAQQLQSTQSVIRTTEGIRINTDPVEAIAKADADVKAAGNNIDNPDAQTLLKVLPPEVINALETGQWTPGAKAQFVEFAKTVADESFSPGQGIGTIDKIMRAPASPVVKPKTSTAAEGMKALTREPKYHGRLDLLGRTLATMKVSSILSAPLTWGIQTGIPLTRLLMEPALDLFNHTLNVPKGGVIPIDLNAGLSRLPITAVWYRQIVAESIGALRLGKMSFEHGQSYFDAYRHSGAFDINANQSLVDLAHNTERGKAINLPEKRGAYNLNEMEFAKHINNSNVQTALNAFWKVATFDIRAQGAIETFQKALAGNSFLYAMGVEEGLEQAAKEGLGGRQAWEFAEQWAKAKIDYFSHDAIVNGKEVTGAINSHPAALKIGRMLTFTDDIRAKMEMRSFGYGQELAREVGIDPKDFDAINKFAEDYKKGVVDPRRTDAGARYASFYEKLRGGERNLPGEGMKTPQITGAWSYLPHKWSQIQAAKHGWIATMIQPFVRSPSEITKQALRTSPLTNWTVDSFYRDLYDESSFFQNHWKSEIAVGAASLTAIWSMLQDENFQWTGQGPLNGDARNLWQSAGMQPMSFRKKFINDAGEEQWSPWLSYRAYEPVAMIFSMAADIKDLSANLTQQQRDQLQYASTAQIAAQVLTGQLRSTYYQGISDFLDVVMPSGFGKVSPQPGEIGKLERYFQKQIFSVAPMSSRMRSLTQMIDPVKRTLPELAVRKEVDPEVGYGKEGEAWEWSGDDELPPGEYGFKETGVASSSLGPLTRLATNLINEFKRNTPFWSKDMPARRNWITGEPLYNPGFLGDEQMPFDEEPWLTQLTSAFVLTSLPMVYSFVPVLGSMPQVVGRKGQELTAKKNYVMHELMRLRGYGSAFLAPGPDDLQRGVTLSAPAYEQYIFYIAQTPHPVTGLTLWEALFREMNSKPYQRIPPDQFGDQYVSSARTERVTAIITQYRKMGKELFLKDPNNPYILEILEERARQNVQEAERDRAIMFGIPPEQIKEGGSTKPVSATEYTQQLNR